MKKFLFSAMTALFIVSMLVFPALAESADPSPVFTIDITQIITSVIGLVFSFILTWLIATVVPPVKKWLKARTTAQQREMLNTLTRQLVYAAEQTIGAGQGKEKLNYVCEQLKERGFTVDLDVIESTVKEMNDTLLDTLTQCDTEEDIAPADE